MKKLIVSLIIMTVTLGLYAQEETEVLKNRKGVPVVPDAGSFAFGIDATPFFRYAGNLFSNNNPYYPYFGFTAQNPGSLFIKYKATNTITYRASLLIGFSNNTDKSENFVDPDQINKVTYTALTVGLAGGIEKHVDFLGRLSGYFGAQVGIRHDPYYDNIRAEYGVRSFKDGNDSNNDYKEVGGNTLSIFAGGFTGVEIYVAPRVALMGELGYYLSYYTQMKRTYKPASGSDNVIDHGSGGFEFEPIPGGSMILLFYF
jgi:hypothetical protein